MPDHPARRLWAALETLHDVTYFAEGVRPAGIALGLRGFWMTYFAFRAGDQRIVVHRFSIAF